MPDALRLLEGVRDKLKALVLEVYGLGSVRRSMQDKPLSRFCHMGLLGRKKKLRVLVDTFGRVIGMNTTGKSSMCASAPGSRTREYCDKELFFLYNAPASYMVSADTVPEKKPFSTCRANLPTT